MKTYPIFLGLLVWFASIVGAFYLGQTADLKKRSIEAQLEAQEKALARSDNLPLDGALRPPLSASDPLIDTVDPDDALQQAASLNQAALLDLLADAFALPADDFRRARMIRELLGKLAESNPEEALLLAANIGSLRETEQARRAILEVWGRQDPQAALNWAAQALVNETLDSRRAQIVAIYSGYGLSNPEAAFSSALALPTNNRAEQRIQNSALEAVIEAQIQNGGLELAKQQVEQLEAGPIKDRLLREMVDEWAGFDPAAAAAYVQAMGDAASARIKESLVGEWAESDPAAAAAWLSQQSFDENTIGRASAAIIREWTRYDMAASAEWLNSLPSSPELDRAVMSYTFRAAQEDPANAMSWAESINNDGMRTRMMERVAGTWKTDDPEGFQAYLKSADFSEEQRELLQNAREGGGMGGGRRWR